MLDTKVRSWLMSFPGMFTGKDSETVMRRAWAACGVACSVEGFSAALDRAGFRVDQVRNEFRLALPAKPLEAPNNVHTLRNIQR